MSGKYGEVRSRKGIPQLKQGAYNPSKSYVENIKLLNDIIADLKNEFENSEFDISYIFGIAIHSRKGKTSVIRFMRCRGWLDGLLETVKRLIIEKKITGKTN